MPLREWSQMHRLSDAARRVLARYDPAFQAFVSRCRTGGRPSTKFISAVSAAALVLAAVVALVLQSASSAKERTTAADVAAGFGPTSRQPGALALNSLAAASPVMGAAGPPQAPIAQPVATTGPIPAVALAAYHRAADASGSCRLNWSLLAGIGKVESDHGRVGGASLDAGGTAHPAIAGPGTAYGTAKGPMQFIDATWSRWGHDGNGDGRVDVQNVYDATLAAAGYLCAAGGDLSTLAGQQRAVFAYNHLHSYVADVLAFAAAYANGLPETSAVLVPITAPAAVTPAAAGAPVPAPAGSAAAAPAAGPGSPAPSAAPAKSSSAAPAPAPAGGGVGPAPAGAGPAPKTSTPAGGPVGTVTSMVPVPGSGPTKPSSPPLCVPLPLVPC